MARQQLVQLLAGEGKTPPQAADHLNRTVVHILKQLRKGESVALPGLGQFEPGPTPTFRFEKSSVLKGNRRARS